MKINILLPLSLLIIKTSTVKLIASSSFAQSLSWFLDLMIDTTKRFIVFVPACCFHSMLKRVFKIEFRWSIDDLRLFILYIMCISHYHFNRLFILFSFIVCNIFLFFCFMSFNICNYVYWVKFLNDGLVMVYGQWSNILLLMIYIMKLVNEKLKYNDEPFYCISVYWMSTK